MSARHWRAPARCIGMSMRLASRPIRRRSAMSCWRARRCRRAIILAVTVDDALQGVSLVTRGIDLFAATHIHRLLQALLDLPTPHYRHHALLTDASGRRLAKRDRALTIRAMRAAGRSPEGVREAASKGSLA